MADPDSDDNITQQTANIKTQITSLQSDVRGVRKEALQKIKKDLHEIAEKDAAELKGFFDMTNAHILKAFADSADACRELAIEIITFFIDRLEPNDYHLTYIIPSIVKRIGQAELIEQSEEIRLLLSILVQNIIKSYTDTSYLTPFFNDFTCILVKTATDAFPAVKIETCVSVMLLSQAIKQDFHMQAESFVNPVLSNMSHRQFRVRVAAVQAIGAIVMNGNAECFKMSVSPMAQAILDDSPAVRSQVTHEIAKWMLHLRDRYSFWHNMIPLMLISMSDDVENNRKEAENLWEVIGRQYMNENEDELKPLMDFMRDAPKHYPPDAIRGNLGCRTLIERNVGKILPLISKEFNSWELSIVARLRSAQLLCWLVLGAESGIMQHASAAISCLTIGIHDEDPKVTREICRASEYFGYFIGPEVWWKLVSPSLRSWPCLAVVANIIKGSQSSLLRQGYLMKITKKLAKHDYCTKRDPKYQLYLLNTCDSILTVCPSDCQPVAQNIFNILLTVYSLPSENDLEFFALYLLKKLQSTLSCGSSIYDLFTAYITQPLSNITSEASTWTLVTPDRCVLEKILNETGPALGSHLHLLSPLLVEALSSTHIDPEVKLKLFTSLSVVLLNRDENFASSRPDHLQAFLNVILQDALVPNLMWAAGRTAEAIRTAAVCCLCAVLQDNELYRKDFAEEDMDFSKCMKSVDLFPSTESAVRHVEQLFPLLVGLVEDNSRLSRLYSLRAVYSLTRLADRRNCFTCSHLHNTYPVVLKRLDDSNDNVRRASVHTLCMLFNSRPQPYDITTFGAHVEALYSAMLIHLDDPEESFQEEILNALKQLSEVHPKLLMKKVGASMKLFRNKSALETLDKHMETLAL